MARALAEDQPVFERWDSIGHMHAHYAPAPDIDTLAAELWHAEARPMRPSSLSRWSSGRVQQPGPDGRVVDLAWIAEKVLGTPWTTSRPFLDLHGEFVPRQAADGR